MSHPELPDGASLKGPAMTNLRSSTNLVLASSSAGPAAITAGYPRVALASALWRRKLSLVLVFILCLAAGAAYMLTARSMYSSAASIYIRQNGPKLLSEGSIATESRNFLYTQAQLMQSTPVLAATARMPAVASSQTLRELGEADRIEALKSVIDAEVGMRDDIIKLTCRTPYAQEAALLANAVVEAYTVWRAEAMRSSAAQLLQILRLEKMEKEAELTAVLQEMVQFKQANRTLSFQTDRGNIAFERLAKLSGMLTESQMEVVNAKADHRAIQAVAGDPSALRQLMQSGYLSGLPGGTDRSEEHRLRSQREQLQVELAARRQESTDRSPAVLVLLQKIDAIDAQLQEQAERMASSCLASAVERLAAAQDKQHELEVSFEKQRAIAEELNIQAARYAVLESQLKRAERSCDVLDSRVKDLSVAEDAGNLTVAVVEAAAAPRAPYWPSMPKIMSLAVAVGLFLAIGTVLVQEWRDERLRSVEEASLVLHARVLGALPMKRWRRLHRGGRKDIIGEPCRQMAESCRRIRTALLCTKNSEDVKTVLVTSPQRGDGKSTLVSNLAIAMARASRRTLIVDADMRKPTQHRIFQIPGATGLTGLLAGKIRVGELIWRSPIDGLDILPCGAAIGNPSELLHSRNFREAMDEVSLAYDYVFVDSPCIVALADAQILAAQCDATVLVLCADKTSRTIAQQAIESLVSVGGRLLGLVVSNVCENHEYSDYVNLSHRVPSEDDGNGLENADEADWHTKVLRGSDTRVEAE